MPSQKLSKNKNQSPTIHLPVFKGKKGEDPEDYILNKKIKLTDLKTLFLRQQESGHKL